MNDVDYLSNSRAKLVQVVHYGLFICHWYSVHVVIGVACKSSRGCNVGESLQDEVWGKGTGEEYNGSWVVSQWSGHRYGSDERHKDLQYRDNVVERMVERVVERVAHMELIRILLLMCSRNYSDVIWR